MDGSPAETRGLPRSTALRIDGNALAARLRLDVAKQVQQFERRYGAAPGLAVVLVGDNPASKVYVRAKVQACEETGIFCRRYDLAPRAVFADLRRLISQLNADDAVDGILLQLPLPGGFEADDAIRLLHPEKDVDGLHITNVAQLAGGHPGLIPCTAKGCERLLRSVRPDLTGEHAVIIGRSQLVGRPLAQLLLRADCTVTLAHSKSRDLPALCRSASIVVAAAGRPELVRGDWIQEDAVVIDAGITRVVASGGTTRIVGDVAFNEAAERASAITPVPGGVGPMTVACLLENVVSAGFARRSKRGSVKSATTSSDQLPAASLAALPLP